MFFFLFGDFLSLHPVSAKEAVSFELTVSVFPENFFIRENAAAMSTISIYRTEFLTFSCNGSRHSHKFRRISRSPNMKMDSKSFESVEKEQLSVQLQKPLVETPRPPSNLRFDRLQPSDQELDQDKKLEFGRFVAREALLDEEFWTTAWLRAESGESENSSGSSRLEFDRARSSLVKFKPEK